MRRILFVDDEPKILTGLRRALYRFRDEWDMVFAEGGAEALAQCAARPFDVVVSDARMPGMEGSELLGEVRKLHPDTVRIILSGQASRKSVLKCVGVAHQFLNKPCDPETLRSAVQKVCDVRARFHDVPTRRLVCSLQSLPTQAAAYAELVAAMNSPTAPLEHAARIVARDLGMSAKVVQLVSSGFYGTAQRVSNAGDAVKLLGLETMQALVDGSAVFSIADSGPQGEEDLRRLSEHSTAVGAAAGQIAETVTSDRRLIGDAQLAGTLHALGALAVPGDPSRTGTPARRDQRGTGIPARRDQRGTGIPARRDQRGTGAPARRDPSGTGTPARRDQLDGQECPSYDAGLDPGGYLAALWGLPDPIVQAIGYHRVPSRCPDGAFGPLTAVHVAYALLEQPQGRFNGQGGSLDVDYLRKTGCADRLESWREICAACLPKGTEQ